MRTLVPTGILLLSLPVYAFAQDRSPPTVSAAQAQYVQAVGDEDAKALACLAYFRNKTQTDGDLEDYMYRFASMYKHLEVWFAKDVLSERWADSWEVYEERLELEKSQPDHELRLAHLNQNMERVCTKLEGVLDWLRERWELDKSQD